jgi:hypothetical protein
LVPIKFDFGSSSEFVQRTRLILEKSLEENTVFYVSSLGIFRFPSDRIVVGNCIAWRDEDQFSKCGRRFLASSKRLTLSRVLE